MTAQPGNVIALIPARGGSKGLPGKNIRPLHGKPLIAHTIEAACQCAGIAQVYVSTDSQDIRLVSEAAGATVILRPPELATDLATTQSVIDHFLAWYTNTHPDANDGHLVLLQPTSPLRICKHIREALRIYWSLSQPSTLVSVTAAKPLSWQGTITDSGQLSFHQPLPLKGNRQSEPDNYILNGAIYCSSFHRFIDRTWMQPPLAAYPMPAEASVDIDTLADFIQAEALSSLNKPVGQAH